MNKKIYFTAVLLVSVFVAMAAVSADNINNQQVCIVSNLMLAANNLDNQVPHFECCNANGICEMGNYLSKHVRLMNTTAITPFMNNGVYMPVDAEADLNAYSYNGLDNVQVKLRVAHLEPNQVYAAWLKTSSGGYLSLGLFMTNVMGRGFLYSQQNVVNFNDYNSIVVSKSSATVLSADLTFTVTDPLTI